MAETYTKEGLKAESRVSLRQIAMKELGMNARQISEMKSETIIDAILEKQGGGGGKSKGKADGKAAKPKEAEKEKEREKEEPDEEGAGGEVGEKIDALGKALDELASDIKGLGRQQYMLFGLLSDIWLNTAGDGKDELEARIAELEKEYEDEGN